MLKPFIHRLVKEAKLYLHCLSLALWQLHSLCKCVCINDYLSIREQKQLLASLLTTVMMMWQTAGILRTGQALVTSPGMMPSCAWVIAQQWFLSFTTTLTSISTCLRSQLNQVGDLYFHSLVEGWGLFRFVWMRMCIHPHYMQTEMVHVHTS